MRRVSGFLPTSEVRRNQASHREGGGGGGFSPSSHISICRTWRVNRIRKSSRVYAQGIPNQDFFPPWGKKKDGRDPSGSCVSAFARGQKVCILTCSRNKCFSLEDTGRACFFFISIAAELKENQVDVIFHCWNKNKPLLLINGATWKQHVSAENTPSSRFVFWVVVVVVTVVIWAFVGLYLLSINFRVGSLAAD